MIKEDSHASTNVTGPQVVGTGSDPIHWKDKKRKLREIIPMVKRKPLLLGQKNESKNDK